MWYTGYLISYGVREQLTNHTQTCYDIEEKTQNWQEITSCADEIGDRYLTC